jgi:hypothetical protein
MPPSDKRGFLQRLGLTPGPPDPEEWVELAESTPGSTVADGLVAGLRALGIEAREKPYVAPDGVFDLGGGPDAGSRVRLAVLVHRRDEARATEYLRAHEAQPISDAELTRQAEAAGES